MAKSKFDNILGGALGISGGYNFHEAYLDEATEFNEEKLKNLKMTSRSKIEFENGSSISFHSADDNNSGRGLRPFVPHPCQEEEFNFYKGAETFISHLIEKGKDYSIKGKLKNGKIFITEQNVEDTDARDDEYILFIDKKKMAKVKNSNQNPESFTIIVKEKDGGRSETKIVTADIAKSYDENISGEVHSSEILNKIPETPDFEGLMNYIKERIYSETISE